MAGVVKTESILSVAPNGFATSYPDSNMPDNYASAFRNMFINNLGNAEKRQGIASLSNIDTAASIAAFHELVKVDGANLFFASGAGVIWLYNDTADPWAQVFEFANKTSIVGSVSMASRQMFYNGVDRNVHTNDGTTFVESQSIIEAGRTTTATTSTMADTTIANWTATNVTQYDIVYYTSLSAYGLITQVASAALSHTEVSADAPGLGQGRGEPGVKRPYQIIDTVSLNIVPVSGKTEFDNKATLGIGSSATRMIVSAIPDWTLSEMRVGDFIYNSTRIKLTAVTAMTTAAIFVHGITGQGVNDELVFLKSSMPIAKGMHVHYQRLYAVDVRDEQKIRITGPNNPNNFGGSAAGTYDIASLQPKGERILGIHSLQKYFVIGTTRNMYFYEGTNPVGTGADFNILGSFPVGIASKLSLQSIGDDILYVTDTGISSTTVKKTASQLVRKLASSQLDSTLRSLIKITPDVDIQMFDYPRRSLLFIKIGGEIYVYNYSVSDFPIDTLAARSGAALPSTDEATRVAWHLFDGPFAQQRCYYVRQNGDLVCGSTQGRVNIFDQGDFSDLGNPIPTDYQSNYTTLSKAKNSKILKKHGKSIRPYIEAGTPIPITISVEAPFSRVATDSVTVTAAGGTEVVGVGVVGSTTIGGNRVFNPKLPLRWAGEQARFRIQTNTTTGPLVIGDMVIYFNLYGAE